MMKLLVPGFWEKSDRDSRPSSVFGTGAAAHYITLRSDVRAEDTVGVNPYVSSYWSYSALTLNEAFERPLPLWFRNGLAEVLSNSIVRDNEIQFGRPIPWHVTSLQQNARLCLSELIALDKSSPYYTNGVTRGRFDAQCWGVMHYMLFGLTDGGSRVNQLAELLFRGASSAEAIQKVFGSVDALDIAYLNYQKKPITQARTLLWTATADADTRLRIETLLRRSVALNNFYSPSQAFLADTIAQGSMPANALPIAIRAASLDPSSASARMTLARALSRLNRRDEAIGHPRAARALAQTDQQRSAAEELIAFLAQAR